VLALALAALLVVDLAGVTSPVERLLPLLLRPRPRLTGVRPLEVPPVEPKEPAEAEDCGYRQTENQNMSIKILETQLITRGSYFAVLFEIAAVPVLRPRRLELHREGLIKAYIT